MRPTNLQGRQWSQATADMVLNRIKRDCADALLEADVAKGLPKDGQVTRMYDKHGNITEDREAAKVVRIDPLWSAMRHDGKTCRVNTRSAWVLFMKKPRDESKVYASKPYDLDNPLGEKASAIPMADFIHWDDDDLVELHKLGIYLDRRPKPPGKKDREAA